MHTVPTSPVPDPGSRIRIIALGDELLAGIGDARALGWLGRAVASEQGADCRIDVFSAALPGETSAELAERWDADVKRRFSEQGRADGSVDHRVVLAMGRADVEAGDHFITAFTHGGGQAREVALFPQSLVCIHFAMLRDNTVIDTIFGAFTPSGVHRRRRAGEPWRLSAGPCR